MKIGLVFLSTLLLSACSTGFVANMEEYFPSSSKDTYSGELPPKNELNLLEEKLVAEMLSANQFDAKENVIAVTSVVDLKSLTKTSRLGQQVSEGVVHYLSESGYRVVDFKLTGTIQVTSEGDFIRSRDWKKLNDQQSIDYLVSGTLDQYEGGSYLNMRMVSVETKEVVGSSQAFITAKQLQSYVASPESIALATKRAKLEAEREVLSKDVVQHDKVKQEVVGNIENNSPQKQKVHSENGFLVRE